MIESHIRVMYHGCSYPTSYYPDKVTWVRVTRLGFARVGLTRVEVWPGSELLTSWMHTFCWCEVGGLMQLMQRTSCGYDGGGVVQLGQRTSNEGGGLVKR
jgi:hypothetical protein